MFSASDGRDEVPPGRFLLMARAHGRRWARRLHGVLVGRLAYEVAPARRVGRVRLPASVAAPRAARLAATRSRRYVAWPTVRQRVRPGLASACSM